MGLSNNNSKFLLNNYKALKELNQKLKIKILLKNRDSFNLSPKFAHEICYISMNYSLYNLIMKLIIITLHKTMIYLEDTSYLKCYSNVKVNLIMTL